MCVGYLQVLCHFTQGTLMSVDYGVLGDPETNHPHILRCDYILRKEKYLLVPNSA